MSGLSSTMSTEEKVRDIRAMLKRGATVDYIRGVFGWGPRAFANFCALHAIVLPGAAPARNLSTREPRRSYARRDDASVRSVTISAVTTPKLAAAIAAEADRRNAAKAHVLHLMLAATHARGLWPDLLDNKGL